jgi:hypothetical protein
MQQRQHDRFKVEFPIVFSGDHAGTGTVYNLGIGGCKIISASVVSTGDVLNLRLSLPTITPPVIVHAATVRWITESEFGVDFLGMQESERDRLALFIDTLVQAA